MRRIRADMRGRARVNPGQKTAPAVKPVKPSQIDAIDAEPEKYVRPGSLDHKFVTYPRKAQAFLGVPPVLVFLAGETH